MLGGGGYVSGGLVSEGGADVGVCGVSVCASGWGVVSGWFRGCVCFG